MERILLLTKCIERERNMEDNLRQLGHEVFLSSQLFNSCIQQPQVSSITDLFKIIVLSDTLTNQEVVLLLRSLKFQDVRILRKIENVPSEDERYFWTGKGIHDWLTPAMSIEEMREILINSEDSVTDLICYEEDESFEKIFLSSLMINFTQQRFLQLLYEEKGKVITRHEMCELLWNRPGNASNLSQLSSLVKVLRKKLIDQGIEGESIITVWGQGYQLSENFYEQVTNEMKVLN